MKAKIFTLPNIIIFLIAIIILLSGELFRAKNPLSASLPYINLIANLAIAALTGLLVGIYFDLFSRKEIYENILHHFSISKEMISSGLINYYPSFMDFDFRNYLSKANKIDMFLTYGQTLFNTYNDTIVKIVGQKKQLTIFMYHEDHIFIDALEKHWNQNGSSSSIKSKIVETKKTLIVQFDKLKKERKIKAKVKLYFIKKHPTFYSFYRFDEILALCPSKISDDKSIRPFTFLFKETDSDDCVFRKCMVELENIISNPSFYELYEY